MAREDSAAWDATEPAASTASFVAGSALDAPVAAARARRCTRSATAADAAAAPGVTEKVTRSFWQRRDHTMRDAGSSSGTGRAMARPASDAACRVSTRPRNVQTPGPARRARKTVARGERHARTPGSLIPQHWPAPAAPAGEFHQSLTRRVNGSGVAVQRRTTGGESCQPSTPDVPTLGRPRRLSVSLVNSPSTTPDSSCRI